MTDIDPNKILAAASASLAKDFFKSLSVSLSRSLSKKYFRYFEGFSGYLERTNLSCANVKTIINKEHPVAISEIYVKTKFKCGNDNVTDDAICELARDGQRVVVTGFGGIGKTIFCKYLFLSVFSNPEGKVPLFFELRKINDLTNKNLSAYLRVSVSPEGDVLSEDIFKSMMIDGRFIFILDGFDEIPDEFKNDIQKQILEMSHLYRGCGFVVSSRLDNRFSSWQEFFVYKALPFEKDQTAAVIEKAKFDTEVKKEFVTNIFNKKYNMYKGFFFYPSSYPYDANDLSANPAHTGQRPYFLSIRVPNIIHSS